MSTIVHPGERISERHEREHASAEFLARGSVVLGTWAEAGLIREVIDGRVAGYWKRLQCGCLLVVDVTS